MTAAPHPQFLMEAERLECCELGCLRRVSSPQSQNYIYVLLTWSAIFNHLDSNDDDII